MSRKEHWEGVYCAKSDAQVSWTQPEPRISLSLITESCPAPGPVIDVGGGTSALTGRLLDAGYDVAVMDISGAALKRAATALGPRAGRVCWIEADVTADLHLGSFRLWHDRAVFHFLTDAADRAAYSRLLSRTIPSGGHAIIATFAPDGPDRCSGLEVKRYDAESLALELGPAWSLLKQVPEIHFTPWGKPQSFQYSLFRRS